MKKRKAAFTLVEMVVAMAIFSLILTFVYKSFFSFAQTTKASTEATVKIQRQRIALKTIEDAFSGLVYYEQNQSIYGFVANTEDYDYPSISFVSRVPPDFLGNKEFGSERLRRITFQVEDDEDYGRSLVMYQSSTLQPVDPLEAEEPSRWVLGQDLDTFLMVFWSTINSEWVYEWTETNSIPTRIKFEMAYVRADGSAAQVEDMQKREIVIFSESITKNMQNPTLPAARGGSSRGRGD
ncbi:MAG: prepilin-type N-terminal cleavage/methylation domain-containing protein, partial [Verrucomicrobiota bacterium]|nr:prepilin-type N-terminal cleavage/methylation domain-containing protein [Verrucomicrobiota bacterium]